MFFTDSAAVKSQSSELSIMLTNVTSFFSVFQSVGHWGFSFFSLREFSLKEFLSVFFSQGIFSHMLLRDNNDQYLRETTEIAMGRVGAATLSAGGSSFGGAEIVPDLVWEEWGWGSS